LCYRNGYFHSALWDIGDPEHFPVKHTYGRLDEALGTVDTEWKTMSFDPATCRPKSESPPTNPLPEWVKGKTVKVLEEIGGILVLDGEKENSLRNLPVSFHPQGAANSIAMPFNSREHHIQGYQPFKGAYFILGTYFVRVPAHPDGGYGKSPWPEGAVRPYWWLYRDGRVVRETLKPSRDPYDTSVLPFRDGIAWHIGFVRGEGLYVTDARGERQAVAGFVQQTVTSPDGCRIAMNHRRSINDPWTTGTLKVIELCKGERK
jgi:hypothetical protein